MKLVTKLTIVLIASVALVLSLTGLWTVHHESRQIEEDVLHDARAYGRNLVELLRLCRDEHGEEAASALLHRFGEASAGVELRWVDEDELSPAERERLRRGETSTRLSGEGSERSLTTLLPLEGQGSRVALEVSESLAQEIESFNAAVRRTLVATMATTLALGLLTAWIGVRLVGQPMHELVVLARRIGQGELGRRLALAQNDEVGELAREMNTMCDQLLEARARLERETAARLEALERLRQADRLVTIGTLAAGVAHEVGTPLNVVQGRAELIEAGGLEPEELRENARIIGALTRRMAGIIRQVLDFARPSPPDLAPHDLSRLTRRVAGMLRPLAARAGVELHLELADPIVAEVDGGKIEQALTNLIVNGVQSMSGGGKVTVRVSEARRAPPGTEAARSGEIDVACLEIADQGVGISPEHLARLWEPFFTTKAVGEGTGLGLPIARELVGEHGGWIEVESETGRGSTFRVILPRKAAA